MYVFCVFLVLCFSAVVVFWGLFLFLFLFERFCLFVCFLIFIYIYVKDFAGGNLSGLKQNSNTNICISDVR